MAPDSLRADRLVLILVQLWRVSVRSTRLAPGYPPSARRLVMLSFTSP
jgi:hypothetical protein